MLERFLQDIFIKKHVIIFIMPTNRVIKLVMIGCLLIGCRSAHDNDHPNHAHGHTDTHTDEIVFTREQAAATELTTEVVSPGTFHHVIKTSGHLEAAQGDEITIVATANGVVTFQNASIARGMVVRSGETLVTLASDHIQDGDPTQRALIEFEAAESAFQRAESLVKDQIISEREYEQARLRYETAKNAYNANASHLSPQGVRVTSPHDGYLTQRLVNQGEYVTAGQAIARISRNRLLHLRADLPESSFHQANQIFDAHFQTAYNPEVFKVSHLGGRLIAYGRSTAESFFLPITFEFQNTSDLLPGMFVDVYLLSKPREGVFTLPTTALTEEQGLFFIYLKVDEESYRKQEVTLGQNDGERVEILSGIVEGDQVVTRGVYQVKLAASASATPEGHSHSH